MIRQKLSDASEEVYVGWSVIKWVRRLHFSPLLMYIAYISKMGSQSTCAIETIIPWLGDEIVPLNFNRYLSGETNQAIDTGRGEKSCWGSVILFTFAVRSMIGVPAISSYFWLLYHGHQIKNSPCAYFALEEMGRRFECVIGPSSRCTIVRRRNTERRKLFSFSNAWITACP